MTNPRPVIGFLTDFGFDGAAATCRAVMIGICPDVQIVDIAHSLRKYAIRDGSFLLSSALPYAPVGVHVGVVDPGVGTARRAIGILTGRGDVLIGPDNGLLPPVADALGGAREARELTNRELWLPDPSHTFHGRDIFSPVAAHLAAGHATFEEVGPTVPLHDLIRLPLPRTSVADGRFETEVVYVDSFGNLRLAGGAPALEEAFGATHEATLVTVTIEGDEPRTGTLAPSFGHVEEGELLVYVDSSGNVALALNQRSLAAASGADTGSRATISRR
jgi:S-adenosylmethionine hydrolase